MIANDRSAIKDLMGTLLRYPYEAKHIVIQKTAEFEPEKFEDHCEEALVELINAKRNGKMVGTKPRPRGENVVDLTDALKKASPAKLLQKAKSQARPQRDKRKCCCQSAVSALQRLKQERQARGVDPQTDQAGT